MVLFVLSRDVSFQIEVLEEISSSIADRIDLSMACLSMDLLRARA